MKKDVDKMEYKGYEKMQELKELLGTEQLFEELLAALGEDKLTEYAEYISRNNDLDY